MELEIALSNTITSLYFKVSLFSSIFGESKVCPADGSVADIFGLSIDDHADVQEGNAILDAMGKADARGQGKK